MRIIKVTVCFLIIVISLELTAQQETTDVAALPDGVIAKRGNGYVTRHIFDARMDRVPVKDRASVLRSTDRTTKILADLLLSSQLKAEAEAAGFDKGDVLYRMQLAAETELANAWLEHYLESQPDADYQAMAREYYLLNKDQFATQPSIDVTHLLVKENQRTEDELETIAQGFLDQVLADPSVFDELVVNHSEDPSVKDNSGRFEGVKEGDMVKPFEDAAFALEEPGDFSGLVKTQYGIHLIRLDKKNPSRVPSFEEVKARLVNNQRKIYREQLKYGYLNELSSAPWEVSEKELESIVERYSNQETALLKSLEKNIE